MGYRVQYARMRGDPFSIGGLLGGVAKFAGGILPGPAGMVLKAAGGLLSKPKPAQIGPPIQQITQVGPAGVIYKKTEYGAQLPSIGGMPSPGFGKRRRRMNPLNPRALRRAASRLNSFKTHVKSVSRALGQPVSFGAKRSSGSRSRRACGCK